MNKSRVLLFAGVVCLAAAVIAPAGSAQKGKGGCSIPVIGAFANADGAAITSSATFEANMPCGDAQTVVLFDQNVSYTVPHAIESTGSLGIIVTGGLSEMADGSIMDASKVQFAYDDGVNKYFLDFGQANGVCTRNSTGACDGQVEMNVVDGKRVWSITGTTAWLRQCAARGKCSLTDVGNVSAPFAFTLAE